MLHVTPRVTLRALSYNAFDALSYSAIASFTLF